jgi:hypothetical protein
MRLAVDIYNHPTSDAVGTPHSPHHRHQRMLHSSGPVTAGSWEPPDNPYRSQLRLADLDELTQGSFVRRLVVLEVVRRWVIRSVTLRNPQEIFRRYSGKKRSASLRASRRGDLRGAHNGHRATRYD